jgi:hypothetical protein
MSAPRELLTNSRLRTFRSCQRRHFFAYEQGWRPVVTAEALAFGSLGHHALEAWWNAMAHDPTKPDDALTLALTAIVKHKGDDADPFMVVKVEEAVQAYHARWASTIHEYEILAVEAGFRIDLLNVDTMRSSTTFDRGGKIDAIVKVRATGKILIVEHKFTSEDFSEDGSPYWAKLTLDTQVSNYFLGVTALGYNADGCLYDVVRRPMTRPKMATPPEARKYRKPTAAERGLPPDHPSLLYANQRLTDETIDEFRERVRADRLAKPESWCERKVVQRLDSDLRDFLRDTWRTAAQIRENRAANHHPRNTDSCHLRGRCAYWNVCAYGERMEDLPASWQRVENVNPELVDPTDGDVS